jgi:uncharacterized protein YjbI with pentapeptide repeats
MSNVRAHMQIDSTTYDGSIGKNSSWSEDNVFRYCLFARIVAEGAHIDSCFLECEFEKCDWYWGLFNVALFVNAKFKNCTFRGCSFADCKFVECKFENCEFTVDNLDKGCSFEGSRWYACQQHNCKGIEGAFKNEL